MTYKLSEKHPGKRAFITGAGAGLGRAFCAALAGDGWTMAIADINEAALAESKGLIESAGGRSMAYRLDVSKKEDFQSAFEDFTRETGGLDLLINNAGVGDGGAFGEYDLEHWDWITGINQMAAIYGSHFAVPVMKRQRSGHIISITSAAGFANLPNMAMYNVPKAAVISLMETLYAELYGFNVNASVVCPAFFRSNIMQFHKGDQRAKAFGENIIRRARHSADEVAHYVLTQAGRKRFYILHPYQARLVFHIKRLVPMFFLRLKASQFARKDWLGGREP